MDRLPTFEFVIDGTTYESEAAVVESFHIGTEDHGIWTAQVRFRGAAWNQSLSGIALDEYVGDGSEERRVSPGTADYLYRLINTIGSPEQAPGRRVVVFRATPYGPIDGFAPLDDDGSVGVTFWNRIREGTDR